MSRIKKAAFEVARLFYEPGFSTEAFKATVAKNPRLARNVEALTDSVEAVFGPKPLLLKGHPVTVPEAARSLGVTIHVVRYHLRQGKSLDALAEHLSKPRGRYGDLPKQVCSALQSGPKTTTEIIQITGSNYVAHLNGTLGYLRQRGKIRSEKRPGVGRLVWSLVGGAS